MDNDSKKIFESYNNDITEDFGDLKNSPHKVDRDYYHHQIKNLGGQAYEDLKQRMQDQYNKEKEAREKEEMKKQKKDMFRDAMLKFGASGAGDGVDYMEETNHGDDRAALKDGEKRLPDGRVVDADGKVVYTPKKKDANVKKEAKAGSALGMLGYEPEDFEEEDPDQAAMDRKELGIHGGRPSVTDYMDDDNEFNGPGAEGVRDAHGNVVAALALIDDNGIKLCKNRAALDMTIDKLQDAIDDLSTNIDEVGEPIYKRV